MRVLMVASKQPMAHNWGHRFLREEFANHAHTYFYGKGYVEPFDRRRMINDVEDEHGPFDVVVTNMVKYCRYWLDRKGMNRVKAKKAHIVVDYHPRKNWDNIHDAVFNAHRYDALFAHTLAEYNHLRARRKEPVFYLPYGVNTSVYKDPGGKRDIDVMAVFSYGSGYPNRVHVRDLLEKDMQHTEGIKIQVTHLIHKPYVRALQRSKIFVGSVNWLKTLTMKVTEAMACGCLYMTDRPDDLDVQGFKDGEHLVLYDGVKDLRSKILYYLKNEEERKQIALSGKFFVQQFFSNELMVKRFLRNMETVL